MKQQLKRLSKAIFKSAFTRKIACFLLAGLIRFIYASSRVSFHIHPDASAYMRADQHAIFAFWHSRLMLMACTRPRGRRMHAMVSIHRDGEWLAQAIRFLGVGLVRGSSRKGGAEAAREALAVLQAHENLGITPDGPRGPFQQAQIGAITLARLTQTPIIPCSYSGSRAYQFASWDKFLLVFPFSHIHVCIGAPIAPHAHESDDEPMRLEMQRAITEQTDRADALAGRLIF